MSLSWIVHGTKGQVSMIKYYYVLVLAKLVI